MLVLGIQIRLCKFQIFKNYKEKYTYEIIVLNFFINDFEKVNIKKTKFFQKNYFYFYTYLNNKINTIFIKFNLKIYWETFYTQNYYNDPEIKKHFNTNIKIK